MFDNFLIHTFHDGNCLQAYKIFGAHFETHEGKKGVRFTTYAPNARSAQVVGEFNQWGETPCYMERYNNGGIYTIFVEGVKEFDMYKFRFETPQGDIIDKADPYAYFFISDQFFTPVFISQCHKIEKWKRHRHDIASLRLKITCISIIHQQSNRYHHSSHHTDMHPVSHIPPSVFSPYLSDKNSICIGFFLFFYKFRGQTKFPTQSPAVSKNSHCKHDQIHFTPQIWHKNIKMSERSHKAYQYRNQPVMLPFSRYPPYHIQNTHSHIHRKHPIRGF